MGWMDEFVSCPELNNNTEYTDEEDLGTHIVPSSHEVNICN